jgi:hypothetical protein
MLCRNWGNEFLNETAVLQDYKIRWLTAGWYTHPTCESCTVDCVDVWFSSMYCRSFTYRGACATIRTVPGSIPGGVTGFFSDIFPSDRTMAPGSTRPQVKMSTRNISLGVEVTGAWGWQPHHLHVPSVMKSGSLKPPGTLWATPGLLGDSFTYIFIHIQKLCTVKCDYGCCVGKVM